jgi:hypothetical protein
LKASKAAEERAPTAELITKARRFMDVSFTLDMFASFRFFRTTARSISRAPDARTQ